MSAPLAVVPGAPLLLPEYTGREDVGADLRERSVAAVRAAADAGTSDAVVLVVATDREQRGTRPPLGQRVGEHLAALAGVTLAEVVTVPWDAPTEVCRELGGQLLGRRRGAALVAVADGSARRGEKAPGHLDERAFALDEAIVGALRDGDADALLALDAELCSDLLVHGRAPLQVVAAVLATPAGSGLRVRVEDPLGVLWLVAGPLAR